MKVSTLSIGDELICGHVTDTNAGTIAALLLAEGVRVQRHLAVGDNEADIVTALNDLGRISDVVIISGGLGPTVDDMTVQAAARATGGQLAINEEARDHARRMSWIAPLNDKQAMVPAMAALIPNPTGTACGFQLLHNGCSMFFLPGVPSEMIVMLRDTVIPAILEKMPRPRVIRTASLNLFGAGEPEVDALLSGIARPEQGLTLGICVTFPWMKVTLRVEAETEEAVNDLLLPALRAVQERAGECCFSSGDTGMDEVVAALFREHGLTLSLAESCSGGLIAARITEIPGSSAYFCEGVVTYSNAAKMRLLGVPAEVLDNYGAVSAECATAMAEGVRRASGSNLGLAVTGVAGPDGGSEEKPVGTVFIALAAPDGCRVKCFRFNGNRNEVRVLTAWTALDWLRRYLLKRGASQTAKK